LEFSENGLGRLFELASLCSLDFALSFSRRSVYSGGLGFDLLARALWHAAASHVGIGAARRLLGELPQSIELLQTANFFEISFDSQR
jgi:hypothetical protein